MKFFLHKFQYPVLLIFSVVLIIGSGVFAYRTILIPDVSVKAELTIVSAEDAKGFDYEVIYTDAGYQPDVLEVPLGSRVAFRNTSDIPMLTASDPHPLHSDFSQFDSRRAYDKGDAYIFRFNTAGTFGYHNHEKSNHRGIIRVVGPANSSPNIDKTKEGQRAVRDKYLVMLNQNDPSSIFTMIDAIEANGALARDCHDMSHDLGHRAYELFGFSGAMTFSNPARLGHTSVDDICAGGYMHGILEEVFLHQPQLRDQPGPICASIPKVNRDSCFHGVGHGLMFVNERNVPASLNHCRSLELQLDMLRCFEGVWMEMFWGDTSHAGSDSLGWTLQTPLVPCMNAAEDEKPSCFLYAHLGYLRNHPRDFTGAVDLCTKSELVPKDAQFCMKGIGITMMKHFTSQHLERSEQLVTKLNYWEKYAYYQGVIGYARLSGVAETKLITFCALLKTDSEICNAVIENGT